MYNKNVYYLILGFALVVFLFIFNINTASAENSSLLYGTTYDSNCYVNPENGMVADDVYTDCTAGNAVYKIKDFDFSEINEFSTVNSISIASVFASNQDHVINIYFNASHTSKCEDAVIISPSYPEYSSYTGVITSTTCPLITINNLNNYFEIELVNDVTPSTTSIDGFNIMVDYSPPESGAEVLDVEEDPINGKITVDLSGDAMYAGADVQCKVGVWRTDSKSGFAQSNTENIATIEPKQATETVKVSNNYYYGYDWFMDNDINDTTWKADNVEMEYHPGWTTKLDFRTNCVRKTTICSDTTPAVCSRGDDEVLIDEFTDTYTFDAGVQGTEPTAPDITNPLAWLVYQARQLLKDFIGNAGDLNSQSFEMVRDQISEKAPFAYVYTAFNTNTNSITELSNAPTMVLATGGDFDDYTWEAPAFLSTNLVTIKNVLKAVLLLMFLVYALHLPNRVLHK